MKRFLCLILIAAVFVFPFRTDTFSLLDNVSYLDSNGNAAVARKADFVRSDFFGLKEDCFEAVEKKLEGKILFTERVGELIILYAYSKKLNAVKEVQEKPVNIMAAYNEKTAKIVIGSPLIMGSY